MENCSSTAVRQRTIRFISLFNDFKRLSSSPGATLISALVDSRWEAAPEEIPNEIHEFDDTFSETSPAV